MTCETLASEDEPSFNYIASVLQRLQQEQNVMKEKLRKDELDKRQEVKINVPQCSTKVAAFVGEDVPIQERFQKTSKHILVVCILCSFIMFISWMNVVTSNRYQDAFEQYGFYKASLMYIMVIVPYLSLPVAIMNCLGLIFYNPYDETNKRTNHLLPSSEHVCFRVVTRGNYPKLVLQNVLLNQATIKEVGINDFVIEVVTDHALTLPKHDGQIRAVVVPDSYVSKNRTLYKARALNYCLENHINTLKGSDWIVHLDEETLLTKSALNGIIRFITENRADIGQGPISYANGDVIQNWITTMADSIRLALDYALFRFQFTCLHAPVFGFKGSYIVLRNRVEMDVGLDFGPKGSIAEDCLFAIKAWIKGYTFDFIPGEMKEKSPFTIMDYIKQRRRWFVGQFYTAFIIADIPLFNKLGLIISVICCILMPLSFSNILINFLFPFHRPFVCDLMTGFVGGTFSFLYAFGAFKSFANRDWSYRKLILVCLMNCIFIIPIAAAMESTAVFWGLFTLNSNEFFVIKKEIKDDLRKTHVL